MNNKEAVEQLSLIDSEAYSYLTEGQCEALNLAIKALEEKEERSQYPSELHMIVARKEEADRAADALDKHVAEWEAKYGSKI